ncbi:heavy metal-associated isoprenylated plant protein 43-like isoform X2 [Juglans microcarpa x Juglans regia]|uniref:heavy metal-associated isoprenylated plant protein 43-like isoform X1 n=1 Tax=Juglans microcarpa x Juglans regia TaxID=2249226 RepID=UPI001B7E320B|nr:heavy metal-associated isoprenylated plant protein 43-like isoform X1 [Juglans microcarpa x Juglans regia]XP_041021891.1 heavy metal-associated isoprenylated plant protein 43-like isoform X2 [Juglans microcarpa x Juglans regia]XP_041021892.1 heavy metal-associated isoprenylated plant protein 43-like isoform X2 [Juglans microcarpa x Juglans regia]
MFHHVVEAGSLPQSTLYLRISLPDTIEPILIAGPKLNKEKQNFQTQAELHWYLNQLSGMIVQSNYVGCIQVISEKKTVVSVELLCSKCSQKVMKLIATIEGITSIVADPSKKTVTVIGEADPVRIIKKVRKFRKTATVVSVGPPKEEQKDERKDSVVPDIPKTCQKCDVWYVIADDYYNRCSIL